MRISRYIKQIIPFIALLGLVTLLGYELFYAKSKELPSPLIGESVPSFVLADLTSSQKFTQKDLFGQVSLLNVWATWCYSCRLEQPMLMKIKEQYQVPIYGIDYKDGAHEAIRWLEQNGNPFRLIGNDEKGDVAIDLGVYGLPETFVISPQGKIIYRHIGAIEQKTWDEVLSPLIAKYHA